ncbi:MAG: selenide, water dikinase SelD, partial [Desulfuromonadales bacterium]
MTALNLVGFPSCSLGTGVLVDILRGGAEKVAEAGAVIVGGHTVEDEEPKYGLAVTGTVDPRKMTTAMGCRPGDRLILTKPLGTGILATALKGEVLGEADIAEAIAGMTSLNRKAAEIMMEGGVSACTDVTGFGLLGHGLEMAVAAASPLSWTEARFPPTPIPWRWPPSAWFPREATTTGPTTSRRWKTPTGCPQTSSTSLPTHRPRGGCLLRYRGENARGCVASS